MKQAFYYSLISLLVVVLSAGMFVKWAPAGSFCSTTHFFCEETHTVPLEQHEFSFNAVENGQTVTYTFICLYQNINDTLDERVMLRDLDKNILRIVAKTDIKDFDSPVTHLSAIQDSIINSNTTSGLASFVLKREI